MQPFLSSDPQSFYMDKQNNVASETPCNLVIVKVENQPRKLSFKTQIERFYLMDAMAQPQPNAAAPRQQSRRV
jgi:hypothetical protein